MAMAIALIVLAGGSVLFYFLSPWHLTPLASNWGAIDVTIGISFWVTGVVFLAISLFMAVALIRYRHQRHRRALYEPENKRLELWLTGITTLGIAALLAPGLFVWGDFVRVPDDAHEVEVVGQQWHWSFRFPGRDGVFGGARNALIDEANPFGLVSDDPHGQDDVLVDRPGVLLPVDRPVKVLLRSKDVLHNFKVPAFRAKMDAIPGQVSYFWFTPTRTGEFQAVCAELCGIAHFAMRARVQVVEPERFEAWLAEQPTHGELIARGPGNPEAGKAHYAACQACHGARGQGQQATNAPRLAGLDADYLRRQLHNFRVGARGTREGDDYGRQMRPFAQSLPDEAAIRDLAAYIETLPVAPTAATVEGDRRMGERLYRSCATCHGPQGQGRSAYRAPRLAGMSDWYLVRQLQHFRAGIRGRHPRDAYGNQMVDMAQVLVDDAAIRDVVAYIHDLPGTASAVARTPGEEE
ncbi:c-type cytochrome [Halomonas stenophila]|uniref:cytochrome-c oxidase n=1 Tax=Halomonas stenophila TaxID=795312 RepID=A0A7W5EXS1_9GAMM|nr:c-type cytochrome [Halomonas stenophila]MBB3232957.1 cytochrome c oxidase subunit 2 [Halomonas stenophila]